VAEKPLYQYRVRAGIHMCRDGTAVEAGGRISTKEPLHEKFANKFDWLNEAEIRGTTIVTDAQQVVHSDDGPIRPLTQSGVGENGTGTGSDNDHAHNADAKHSPTKATGLLPPGDDAASSVNPQVRAKKRAEGKQPGDEDGEWEPDATPEQEAAGNEVTEDFLQADAKGFAVYEVGEDQYNVVKKDFRGEPLTDAPLTKSEAKKYIKTANKG
jgi:hypothetical protein